MAIYPVRLIPKSTSKLILELDPNDILCRGVDSKRFSLRDEMGDLNALAVEEIRIPGYSTNKIPPAEIDDIQLGIDDKEISRSRWEEGMEGWEVDESIVFIAPERQYFLIRIGDIDGYQSTFPINNSTAHEPDSFKCKFILRVKHAPLIANYSHFEFEFEYEDEGGGKIKNASRKVQEKIINADVRQRLIEVAKFSVTDF